MISNKASPDEPITIDHSLLIEIRQWWLLGLDILERLLGREPRTSDLRKMWKRGIMGLHKDDEGG